MCRSRYHHGAHHAGRHAWHHHFSGVPVNIREFDDSYELSLFAPGLTREDFKLQLVDRLLVISVEGKENPFEAGVWKRRDYQIRDFERSFELNEKIDLDSISASYEAGVLLVKLSKLADRVTLRRELDLV
ncbi:MAG TPA: Hsp20/alpha crystallin family protein [Saprospiraceae bacterium]|nr:Hsp20/alpha crystallin family protein [Saprospiraceae bacterium]HMQ82015.1 Hsp20/alpha crystallin family protein [Saprospiraceae bacterium]